MTTTLPSRTNGSQEQVASSQRIEPGSVNIPIGKLPKTAITTSPAVDEISEDFVNRFNEALSKKDTKALTNFFLPENGFWRDHLALSWDLRTLKGAAAISDFLAKEGVKLKSIAIDRSSPFLSPTFTQILPTNDVKGIVFFIKITTEDGTGRGVVRLAEEEENNWKIFTFTTVLTDLHGNEELVGHRRPRGVEHGHHPERKNWQERREANAEFADGDPAVLVIGAGQAGLAAAARLKTIDVEALVIDTEDRIGDNWRRRYRQLVLHDPVWSDHMPYIHFPANWPIFTPKDKLAGFLEAYAELMELNVWTRTRLVSSSYDEKAHEWTATVERTLPDGSKVTRTFHPRHIILATGHSGKINYPVVKGMDGFKGDLLCHSSEFPGAKLESQGKKAVIVGSCNSGHDIAQDYVEKGYDVTMVQRSSTCVVSSEGITDIGLKGLYDQDAPPIEDADLWAYSIPGEIFKLLQSGIAQAQAAHDAETLKGLEKAGFKLDMGPDNAGLMIKYFERGGGYYINVGASQLIIDGKIKVKQGQEITEVLPHGLKFADGTELEADEIVFATGFGNMRDRAREILGDEVAERLGGVWGYDNEGEMRNIWRRSGHPGVWFMGGNLSFCRYFSRHLALQIKALELGLASY